MLLFYSTLAFLLSFSAMPATIRLAWQIGAVDEPKDWRRMHVRKIPRAGGIAVFLSFFVSCLSFFGTLNRAFACALGGGFLLLLVGLADDIFCLGVPVKLFFQVSIATASVIGSGLLSGWSILFGGVWVLTLANAHNFIDGLDGLFAGCAVIEGCLLSLALHVSGAGGAVAAPLILASACLGFLLYNRHPAMIFAGDCGSVTVGFLLGMFSLPLFSHPLSAFSPLSPFFLFALPLTDLLTAVMRRTLRGRSVFSADRAHLHHRLTDAGLTQPQCVLILLSLSLSLGLIGVFLTRRQFLEVASVASAASAILLIIIRHFIADFA
jgi:UDP-GlcNAc:undecaprenyl-phosphate GlcNAc-1-phosphate transferase